MHTLRPNGIAVLAAIATAVDNMPRWGGALTTGVAVCLSGARRALAAICAICAVVALASCSRSDSVAVDSRSKTPPLATLEANLKVLEESEQKSPRDRWDPDYVIGTVGRDPQQLFAWVRDNTYWIPYRGVLRGPIGVLMDGQGNSLDRALLLATLLEKAGHAVRLAHGDVTHEQAVALLPGLAARQFVFASERMVAGRNDRVTRASSKLNERVADQTERLLRVVRRPDAREAWDASFDAALAALRDHWWVQQNVGEAWIDLDPLARAASPSKPLAAVKDTLQLKDLAGASLHHEIAVRVIAEQWSDGVATEHKSLEHVLRPANLIGQPVVLQFWPTEWPADSAPPFDPKSDIRSALLDQREWGAMLVVGQEITATGMLEVSGDDPDAPIKGGAFAALAAGGSDAFRSPTKTKTPDSTAKTLSAVWLEYEIRVPGEASRTIRRAVFDLLGPAARTRGRGSALQIDESKRLTRSSALMMRTEILALSSAVAPEFVAHLVTANLLEKRELLRGVARGDTAAASTRTEDPPRPAVPAVSSLYALALARQTSSDARFEYFDRPTLFTSHSYPAQKTGGVAMIDAIDVVANEVGVNLAARDAFAVRLAQGVRDTNAEAMVRRGSVSFGNAGDAFAKSSAWVTLASPDRSAVDRLQLPDDTRRRILEDLTAGYVVVAPEATVPMTPEPFAGWWRVDPATGQALGFGGNGWGVEMVEESGGAARGARMSPFFKKLMVRATAGFVSGYGWCIVPKIFTNIETLGLRFGLQALPGDQEECAEWGGVFAVLATVPLLIGQVKFESCSTEAESVPPEPPVDPLTGTQPDLSKTQRMPNAPDPMKTLADSNARPPEPASLPPRTLPNSIEQARENLFNANARRLELQAARTKANQEYVRYAAKHYTDPAEWNKDIDNAFLQNANGADQDWLVARNEWQQAQRDLSDVLAKERGACGHGGFPPPNAPSK